MAHLDMSSVVETVAWYFLAICTIAVAARSVSKARIIQHIGADDVFIWIAWVCFVGQCVSVQLQAQNGVGADVQQVDWPMRDRQLKAEYANYLLYMPVIACAKLSVVSVLRKCALNRKDRLMLYMFEWFLAAWAISAELVRLFPCAIPAPWDYVHMWCIDRQAWVVCFEVVNILTELALIIIPILIIWKMPTSTSKKLVAITYFSARILIVPASISRIVYWVRASVSADATYDLYPFTISTVAVAVLEVLAGCVLYVRSLFEILETGFSVASINSPTSPKKSTQRAYGPYSKGTWPFTHMSTLEEHLTSRAVRYEASVQAAVYDRKSSLLGAGDGRIHIYQQVDVHTIRSPPAPCYQERAKSMDAPPRRSSAHPAWRTTTYDKELPALPGPQCKPWV